MSEHPLEDQRLPHAKEIKARAAAWLERKDSGTWTDKDEAELDAWLAESSANLIAYRRVSHVWGRTERLVALRPPALKHPTRLESTPAVRPLLRIFMGVAAVALLSVIGASEWRAPETQTYTTAVGGRDILTLPDGSRIELNTDTSVRVSDAANERKVWLDKGEAYFQVVHNVSRPFIVIAGARRVTDIGTKFVMRRDIGKLSVDVLDGKIRLDTEENDLPKSNLLRAGDSATATANAVVIVRKAEADLATALSWRQGVFVFRRATLEDAAQQYNRYNRLKIVIANPEIAKLTLSGTLPTNDVEAFVGVARNFFSLNVVRRDGEIVLSPFGRQERKKSRD